MAAEGKKSKAKQKNSRGANGAAGGEVGAGAEEGETGAGREVLQLSHPASQQQFEHSVENLSQKLLSQKKDTPGP